MELTRKDQIQNIAFSLLQLRALSQELWQRACAFDGIKSGVFVVFSDGNPHAQAYNEVGGQIVGLLRESRRLLGVPDDYGFPARANIQTMDQVKDQVAAEQASDPHSVITVYKTDNGSYEWTYAWNGPQHAEDRRLGRVVATVQYGEWKF